MAGARAGGHASKYSYKVRDRDVTGENYTESLSHSCRCRRSPCRSFATGARSCASCSTENLPGAYPYTGGVYPYRREAEDPTRMFAGEGAPERTNRRFHYLAGDHARRAALHRVRFHHAVRRRPRHASRHLRPHRQLRRVDRHARRHEEAVFGLRSVRADHFRVDDHQRPGADDPRHVHEHRDRSARRALSEERRALGARRRRRSTPRIARRRSAASRRGYKGELPAGPRRHRPRAARRDRRSARRRPRCTRASRPRRCRPCAAPCRPTSSRRTRRRTPASSRPSSRCA